MIVQNLMHLTENFSNARWRFLWTHSYQGNVNSGYREIAQVKTRRSINND